MRFDYTQYAYPQRTAGEHTRIVPLPYTFDELAPWSEPAPDLAIDAVHPIERNRGTKQELPSFVPETAYAFNPEVSSLDEAAPDCTLQSAHEDIDDRDACLLLV